MVKTIAPLSGWALDTIASLDCHAPGFAGQYLRASDERRQVTAAYLAASPVEIIVPEQAREAADFLSRSNHRTILHRAFGSVSTGFRGALGRSGPQPHQPRFYTLLHQTLSRPAHAHIVPTIQHLPTLDLMKLRVAHALPAEVCTANVVDAVGSVKAAHDVRVALDLLTGNGVDSDALFGAIRRVESSNELASVWKRWALRTAFGEHPVPASDAYAPVSTAAALKQLARRYRNCAERYIVNCLDGHYAFGEFRSGNRGLVVHLRRRGTEWVLEDLFGKNNNRPDPDLHAEASAYLGQHGIAAKRKDLNTSGEWAVMHRLCSFGFFGFDEDD